MSDNTITLLIRPNFGADRIAEIAADEAFVYIGEGDESCVMLEWCALPDLIKALTLLEEAHRTKLKAEEGQ